MRQKAVKDEVWLVRQLMEPANYALLRVLRDGKLHSPRELIKELKPKISRTTVARSLRQLLVIKAVEATHVETESGIGLTIGFSISKNAKKVLSEIEKCQQHLSGASAV